MFEVLERAIEEVDIPLDGAALRKALLLLDRLTAKVTAAGAAFDAHQLWDLDGATSTRTPARRRADALADIARFFLAHHDAASAAPRHRSHVNLVVDLDARLAGDPAAGRTVDGTTLSPTTIARILCDCGVHRVVTSGGSTVLDYGRTTRTIPASLFNALVIRDRHCRWPGCDRSPSWCEGHHLHHWEHGGSTNLANLVLLCSRHHHRAHTPGWRVKLHPDATFEVITQHGRNQTSRPPPHLTAG